ncbi:hypothetical protein G6011_05383 [Alternaria panax]|uniref:Uncharacterized protein n=1 Tax=Alternaria panax TaxID=48097 RepID=A0AAD4I6P8_9PLEO|nr:hypothetical protein G6011_05383 [Alternaria panax]
MKFSVASVLALLGVLTIASGHDGKVCDEGEKQCILNGQKIHQCINDEWTIVKVCKSSEVYRDTSTTTGLGNDLGNSAATEDCRDGDVQCEVLPLILLGRHAIKHCNGNDNHKWFIGKVCNSDDVCDAEPYPHCASIEAVEAREEDKDEASDKDSIDAASFMISPSLSFDQINKAEMPCTKCKNFRDKCTANCYKWIHYRTAAWCQRTCMNKMRDYLVENVVLTGSLAGMTGCMEGLAVIFDVR